MTAPTDAIRAFWQGYERNRAHFTLPRWEYQFPLSHIRDSTRPQGVSIELWNALAGYRRRRIDAGCWFE